MDTDETMQRYQELLRKYDRNDEERLELENERNEILNHKSAAVREKWLRQLGKCARGNSGLEQKFANESIQETIDLCHQHLKGLDNDLKRLDDTRKKLLVELEDLKACSNCELTDINNNGEKGVARIIITTTASLGKRRRNSSKDEPLSPTRLERRYELQRKIDEELRKLQLAEKMAQDRATENVQLSNGVTDASFVLSDTKNGTCQQSQESVECDNHGNGIQEDLACNDEDEKSPATDTSALNVIQNEIENQNIGKDQIGDVIEFHEEQSDTEENQTSVIVVATDCEGDIGEDYSPTQEVESDSILSSTTVTSSTTTTTTTSTLLLQTNSTTPNNDESFPRDEIVSEPPQNMEVVTIEQAGSLEITAIDDTSSNNFDTQESFESGQQPDVVQSSSVDPVVQTAVENVMVTVVSEVSMPIEVKDQSIREELKNSDINLLIDVNQRADLGNTENMNKRTNLTDEVANTPPPSPVTSIADEASESEIVTAENNTTESKPSSDDEEYSGCDIEMGGTSSYNEEVSVTEEIVSPKCDITEACDEENNPIFVDIKYSVGEQINIVAQDENALDMPSPSMDYIGETSAPWDSSGQIIVNADSVTNDSLPSNNTDSGSRSSSRCSLSEDDHDAETKAVAEQTVSNAIQAAYEIYTAKLDEHPRSNENEVVDTSDVKDTAKAIEERDDAITMTNTSEGVDEVESSSLSCSRNEGDETDSSELVITTLHRENDHSQHELDADTESGARGSFRDDAEEYAEIKSSAIINESILDSVLSHADSSPTTKLLTQESDFSDQIIEDADTTADTVDVTETCVESKDKGDHDTHIAKEEQTSTPVDMPDEQEPTRNATEKITYNPALSQRNTEATKWFGQPTSENKIWMKPSGRLDTSAEMERKRLIKAMTRRNNPNLVPKWEPPKEKDFTEDLDDKHKESLKKYEERRRTRIATPSSKEEIVETESTSEDATVLTKELPRENIVVESVVHSRDAISIWESRLSEKHYKEALEKQRLSVGKQNRTRPRATSEIVTTGQDSSASTISTDAILPSSEHIERESVDISEVRNRWKVMDKSNKSKQPEPPAKKISSSRRSTFTVNTAPAFRSSQSPSAAIHQQDNSNVVNARNSGLISVSTSKTKESQIDREIREAAEREEKWKQEQWEKMSEISTVSSEDTFPDRGSKNTSESTMLQINDTNNVQSDRSLSTDSQNHSNGHKEADSESLSSYESGTGNVPSSPRSSLAENSDKADAVSRLSNQEGADSGIDECSIPTTDLTKSSPLEKPLPDTSNISLEVGQSVDTPKEEEAVFRRKRISSLTHAVTPRGWDPSKTRVGPVSPVSPLQRSFSRPEIKKVTSPTAALHPVEEVPNAKVSDIEVISSSELEVSQTKLQTTTPEKSEQSNENNEDQIKSIEIPKENVHEVAPKIPEIKKGGPIFIRKSGGPVGVSSSKSQLQTIMAREMEDAAARETEWRKKQMELVNKGVDLSAHSVAHSTREIRTPAAYSAPPPGNTSEQTNEVKLRRPVRSLFDDYEDESEVNINTDVSDEFKKREVVKAMRVPKRKSLLAMRWEEGQYQNTAPDDEN